MPNIRFTKNLERHVSCPSKIIEGETLISALLCYFELYNAVQSYVLDDQNRLRKHMNIAINGVIIQDKIHLADPVKINDEIFIFQALSGG